MHAEQQTEQAVEDLRSWPPAVGESKESSESKPQRGGKRAGAGRKPNLVKRMISRLSPATAREVLATVDVEKVIEEIFKKGSLTLKQRTLADLWDRAWGRPAQALSVSGTVLHAHWTPGKYSHLTDEEFAKLAELTTKALAPPDSGNNQNAPNNQTEIIESKPVRATESAPEGDEPSPAPERSTASELERTPPIVETQPEAEAPDHA